MWWIGVLIVTVGVVCGDDPYANNFPYVKYEYGKGDRNAEGGADRNSFLQNKLSASGNNAKAALDLAKFYNNENLSNGHVLQHNKQGASTDSQKQATGEDFENDKSHKRKHVKSGFHNTYHKDESGSNSSFYEDSDDRGGKLVYEKRHGVKGDSNDSSYKEGLRDGSARDKVDNRVMGFDNRGSNDRQHYLAENQGNRHGHRDGYHQGQSSAFEGADGNRGYYQPPFRNRFHNTGDYGLFRPTQDHSPLSDNFIRPHFDMQLPSFSGGHHSSHRLSDVRPNDDTYFNRPRITIYEDPRDLIDPRNNDRRRADFGIPSSLERNGPVLDFRPSPIRFRDFDDYRFRNY